MTRAPVDEPEHPAGGEAAGSAPVARRVGRGARWRRRLAWGLALLVLLAVPWWGRAALQRLDFFHVRAVDVQGTRFLDPAVVVRQLHVDTLHSIWDELEPLERRLRELPQVQDVTVRRRLPGTLLVEVEEHEPVAFVTTGTGLEVRDADGRVLPIDPSRVPVDLPVITSPDSAVLQLLGDLRERAPALYRRVSHVSRSDAGELRLRLFSTTVRASSDVTARRLSDILLVEAELARRRQRAAELDLRFRDQVIARLQ